MIQKAQQFHEITKAITYLDNMLSGAYMDPDYIKVTEEMVSKLKSLFDYYLKKKTKTKHPKYIYSAFTCFVKHKTHIQLNMEYLSSYNKQMRNLIMYSVDKSDYDWGEYPHRKYIIKKSEEGDFNNLFRPEVLQIFTTVKTMTIDTTHWSYNNKYTFSLFSLFRLIETSALEKVLVIGGQWLDWNSQQYWKQETKELIQQTVNKAGYNIKVQYIKEEEWRGKKYKVYECVIEKKK